MKKTILLSFVVACLALLSSCTQVVQVSVPNGSTYLVVDAFLDNGADTQKVRLTTTAPYFSNQPTPGVSGATVLLQDLTSSKTYTLTDDGKGNYYQVGSIAHDTMIKYRHNYQLNILYNGNTYYATSTAHRTIAVDTIVFRSRQSDVENKYPNDTTNPKRFFPMILAFDSIGPDYYWEKVYNNGVYYSQPRQLIAFQDDGVQGMDGKPLFWSVSFFGLTSDQNPIHRYDTCTVKILSINEDTYEFLTQLQTQLTNAQSGLFAVTPENVKTNIKQNSGTLTAIGWFNTGLVKGKSVIAR
ncbi:MAG: DUF4249 domain-containing protein [Bacteroidetes bacterium]|nr:DUF4249 domain-containing protein [Bacteroidota bacterium]